MLTDMHVTVWTYRPNYSHKSFHNTYATLDNSADRQQSLHWSHGVFNVPMLLIRGVFLDSIYNRPFLHSSTPKYCPSTPEHHPRQACSGAKEPHWPHLILPQLLLTDRHELDLSRKPSNMYHYIDPRANLDATT